MYRMGLIPFTNGGGVALKYSAKNGVKTENMAILYPEVGNQPTSRFRKTTMAPAPKISGYSRKQMASGQSKRLPGLISAGSVISR